MPGIATRAKGDAGRSAHRSVLLIDKKPRMVYDGPSELILPEEFRLGESTKVKGPYERAMKTLLLSSPLQAYYEPLVIKLGNCDMYPPDFMVPLTGVLDGTTVLFELHPKAADSYLERMDKIRRTYGDQLYLVLVVSGLAGSTSPVVMFKGANEVRLSKVDEIWKMPKIPHFGNVDDVSHDDAQARQRWMDEMRVGIGGLLERTGIMQRKRRKRAEDLISLMRAS